MFDAVLYLILYQEAIKTLFILSYLNDIHYRVWDEITYPFTNFNGTAVEVWGWISYFVPHFTRHVITYHVGIKVNKVASGYKDQWTLLPGAVIYGRYK